MYVFEELDTYSIYLLYYALGIVGNTILNIDVFKKHFLYGKGFHILLPLRFEIKVLVISQKYA